MLLFIWGNKQQFRWNIWPSARDTYDGFIHEEALTKVHNNRPLAVHYLRPTKIHVGSTFCTCMTRGKIRPFGLMPLLPSLWASVMSLSHLHEAMPKIPVDLIVGPITYFHSRLRVRFSKVVTREPLDSLWCTLRHIFVNSGFNSFCSFVSYGFTFGIQWRFTAHPNS